MALVAKTEFHVTHSDFDVTRFEKGFPKDELPEEYLALVGDHVWEDDGKDAAPAVPAAPAVEEPKGDDLDSKTVAELKELASDKGVEVTSNKKAEILEALRAADA